MTSSYAASARDSVERFGRKPTENARPLLILWPFGPVALVYDVLDTEGRDLPAQHEDRIVVSIGVEIVVVDKSFNYGGVQSTRAGQITLHDWKRGDAGSREGQMRAWSRNGKTDE